MTFKIPAADGVSLPAKSREKLLGIHPDLVRVVERAYQITPFKVTHGLRTMAEQRQFMKEGRSKTLNSRHLTGHAVDLCEPDGGYDMPDMQRIAIAMRQAAKECNVPIEWGALKEYGGDWSSFNDSPHFQLPWKQYPAKGPVAVTDRVKQAVGVAASARAVGGAVAGTGATVAASNPETVSETVSALPAVPETITQTIANGSAWQAIGDEAWKLVNWFAALPLWAQAPLVCSVALVAAWPHIWPAKPQESD